MDGEGLRQALAAGPVPLDGGLAIEVEERGHDLSGPLWSGRLIADAPAAVLAAHRAFLQAGARVVTTASYQLDGAGWRSAGRDPTEYPAVLRAAVSLARRAQEEAGPRRPTWVAASVGPFGATIGDGSEYTGRYALPERDGGAGYDVPRLRTWHRPRLAALAESGPDVLACETIPCLAEAEALLTELAELDLPAWLSLTAVPDADGVLRTRLGEPAREAFAMAGEVPQVLAVGVNCVPPETVAGAVRTAIAASGRPAVVYPNSGETWDADRGSWVGPVTLRPEDAARWVDAGARLVGGCCRVGARLLEPLIAALPA